MDSLHFSKNEKILGLAEAIQKHLTEATWHDYHKGKQ